MKNKKVVYLLLAVVVLIWGIIFYRIFATVGVSDNNTNYRSNTFEKNPDNSESDTFNINGTYRDPFLGTIHADKPRITSTAPGKIIVKEEKVVQKLAWPSLGYGGMIKNQKSNKQLVLVQINGKNNLMKSGDIVEGVQLLKIVRDSLEVSFQKEKKWITK